MLLENTVYIHSFFLCEELVLITKASYFNDDRAYRAVDTESDLSFEKTNLEILTEHRLMQTLLRKNAPGETCGKTC